MAIMWNPFSSTHIRRVVFVSISLLPSVLAFCVLAFVSSFLHRPPTKLMEAVRKNQGDEVKTLLAQRVDVNEKGTFGWTALWVAADKGNARVAKLLIDAGANVNDTQDNGESILMRAIGYASWPSRSPELVKLLLAHGADVHARWIQGGQAALHLAATLDQKGEVVRVLLRAGADVNASDCAGNVPIGLAVKGTEQDPPRGSLDVIRQLLEAGAHPPQYTVARLRTLAANDKRALELLGRATVIVPAPYRDGRCRLPDGRPSEQVLALKAWCDEHHLPLSYAVWSFFTSASFGLLIWFSTPALLVLLAAISRDRTLAWWSGGLLVFVLTMLHVLLMLALITD